MVASKVIDYNIENVINLHTGEPDFATPKHIIETAIKALKEGKTHYPPKQGLPELRTAIVEYYGKYGVDWKPSEVILTAGSGLALFFSIMANVNPGEEIILFEPYYMAYRRINKYFGIKDVPVPLKEENGYHLDVNRFKESVTPKTKMILLCNPNNPTGTVYSKEELLEIADIARKKDLIVLSDEVYNEFLWDGRKHYSIAALPGMKERSIICMSFSKTFAMTGCRLGYLIANKEIVEKLLTLGVRYHPSTFMQLAGISALKGSWDPVKKMANEYNLRINHMVPLLNEIDGITCQKPEGAFYLFPNIEATGLKSVDFCKKLLDDMKISVRAGIECGVSGEYHIRLALVKPIKKLEKAANAIEIMCTRIRASDT